MLNRNKREGFRLSGVATPSSIADHVTVAAQLAYIIGELEGLDGKTCATMVLFHDNGEARITDHHKVSARYLDKNHAEWKAYKEQMNQLPSAISGRLLQLQQQYKRGATAESIVARDADWLEAAIQAKIYSEQGYHVGQWVNNVKRALRTPSAKALLVEIERTKHFTTSWWQGLKKLNYKKLYR